MPNTMYVEHVHIEGASILKDEHLAVFDCANKCGRTGTDNMSQVAISECMAAAQLIPV